MKDLDALQAAVGGVRARAVPVVEQGREQRQLSADPTGPLRQRQRRVLMLQQIGQPSTHHLHGLTDTQTSRQPHRQSIDEQTRHPVRTSARTHPTEQHRTEHHVITTRSRRHHPRPHHMEQRRRTHPKPTRTLPHPDASLGRQRTRTSPIAVPSPLHVHEAERGGRLLHISKQAGEELFMFLPRDPQPGLSHVAHGTATARADASRRPP